VKTSRIINSGSSPMDPNAMTMKTRYRQWKKLNKLPGSHLVGSATFPGPERCLNVIVREGFPQCRNGKLHYWRAWLKPGFRFVSVFESGERARADPRVSLWRTIILRHAKRKIGDPTMSFEFIVGLSHSESENENERERKRER